MTYYRVKHREGTANKTSGKRFLLLCICSIVTLIGCAKTPQQYKLQADEEVYKEIDSTWKQTDIERVDYNIESAKENLTISDTLTLDQAVKIAQF